MSEGSLVNFIIYKFLSLEIGVIFRPPGELLCTFQLSMLSALLSSAHVVMPGILFMLPSYTLHAGLPCASSVTGSTAFLSLGLVSFEGDRFN